MTKLGFLAVGLLLATGSISLGVLSFVLSFTKARRHWVTLACAITALVLGFLWMALALGREPTLTVFGFVDFFTSTPFVFGLLGILRWMWHRSRLPRA